MTEAGKGGNFERWAASEQIIGVAFTTYVNNILASLQSLQKFQLIPILIHYRQ